MGWVSEWESPRKMRKTVCYGCGQRGHRRSMCDNQGPGVVSSLGAGDKDPGGLAVTPHREYWYGSRSSRPGSPSRAGADLSPGAGADLSPRAGAGLSPGAGAVTRSPQGGADPNYWGSSQDFGFDTLHYL